MGFLSLFPRKMGWYLNAAPQCLPLQFMLCTHNHLLISFDSGTSLSLIKCRYMTKDRTTSYGSDWSSGTSGKTRLVFWDIGFLIAVSLIFLSPSTWIPRQDLEYNRLFPSAFYCNSAFINRSTLRRYIVQFATVPQNNRVGRCGGNQTDTRLTAGPLKDISSCTKSL
jgi:hypothetical protein